MMVIIALIIITSNCIAQSDISGGGGHAGAGNTGYYVGWDANTTFDLDVKQMATGASAKNIKFFTNATQKMTILGNNGSTDGYVGIGTASPSEKLSVAGNVNVVNAGGYLGYYLGSAIFMSVAGSGSNVVIGQDAGSDAIGGSLGMAGNTFVGFQAGHENNASGYGNCYFGLSAGYSDTSGSYNTCAGYAAGGDMTSASSCVYLGSQAGRSNNGDNNVMVGVNSGYVGGTQTGTNNTFVGTSTGSSNSGSSNTLIGYGANISSGLSNSAAFGNNASVTASNKMFFGDANVTGCYNTTGVWSTSDARFKTNINENVSGLEFISKLRPVTYNLDTKKLDDFLHQGLRDRGNSIPDPESFKQSSAIVHAGFIAQEVEKVAKECGFTSSIVSAPANDNDPYAVNYAELVVPLVKAVQQLNSMNQSLQNQLNDLQTQVDAKGSSLQDNCNQSQAREIAIDITLASKTIVLDQNQPNPFKEQTTISYFIPDNTSDVKIIFTDSKGSVLKEVSIPEKGAGKFNVYAQDLSAGVYSYTLVADGITVDSKKMICNK